MCISPGPQGHVRRLSAGGPVGILGRDVSRALGQAREFVLVTVVAAALVGLGALVTYLSC